MNKERAARSLPGIATFVVLFAALLGLDLACCPGTCST